MSCVSLGGWLMAYGDQFDNKKEGPPGVSRRESMTCAVTDGRSRRGKTITAGRDGKRDIKRSERVPASRQADEAPGMAAIIAASLLTAARRGNCASLAASSQGSTPSRASTESTLSGVSSLFLSIRANKNLSNFERKIRKPRQKLSFQSPAFVLLIWHWDRQRGMFNSI